MTRKQQKELTAIDELRDYVDQLQVLSYKIARFSAGDRMMGRKRRKALRYLDEAVDQLISSIGEERSFGEEMLHCRVKNKQDLRIASIDTNILMDKYSRFERGVSVPDENERERIIEEMEVWDRYPGTFDREPTTADEGAELLIREDVAEVFEQLMEMEED